MIFGSLTPWIALGTVLALIGAFLGGDLHGAHAERVEWQAATAKLQAAAATTLATETARVAALDAKAAELSNQLDATNAKAVETATASADAFSKRLRLAASGRCGNRTATPEAAHPGVDPGTPAVSDDGPGSINLAAVQTLRDAALSLQRFAVTCHSFAIEVGR